MKTLYAAVAAVALLPAAAIANERTQTGTDPDGKTWIAQSSIVGQTSTATVVGGGSPIYLAPNAAGYSGVVGLLMRYSGGGGFVCSGSLTRNNSIVTAAHCVSNGVASDINGRAPGLLSTTAFFYDNAASITDNSIYAGGPGITQIAISDYRVHSGYTGEVIDQNDIAVLRLSQAAPAFAEAYDVFTGDINGEQFNVAGFGARSDTGGAVGDNLGTGRRRQGDNVYDFRLGEFYSSIGGTAEFEFSYLSDFDNGTDANDAGCLGFGICNTGLGAREVSIAGGDSGGPGFINRQIASINSYGLTFGSEFGDFDDELNSSWGEFNGFVPTFIHADFINGVPEPGTWAMMILGFGFVGGALRRRGKSQLSFA